MRKPTKRTDTASKARVKSDGRIAPVQRKAKRTVTTGHHGAVAERSPRYNGGPLDAVHASASDLLAVGAIGKQTMREYDELCIEAPKEISARGIKALRESLNMSQPVFARRIYVSPSTVAKWESGANKPSGIALKYLNVLRRLGATALD